MDVRLPDGTIIKNVPEGTTKADLAAKLQRGGMAVPADWLAPAPKQPRKLAKEDTPGLGSTLMIGAGKTFDSILDGITQMYLGARGEESALRGLKENVGEKSRLYQPLKEARPFATGVGEALPSMVLPGGGAATLLGNAGRMAAAGAAPELLQYGSLGDRAQRAAIGGAAGAAVPVLGAGMKTGWAFAEPLFDAGRRKILGRTLNRVAGDSAPDVAQRMAQASELVPGSMPTAAQVAESGGMAALERAASASNPEAYTQRAMQQAAARMAALRGIAGDETSLAAAKSARRQATAPLYAQVSRSTAQANPTRVVSLIDRMMQANPANKALVRPLTEIRETLFDGDVLRQSPQHLKSAMDNVKALLGNQENAFVKRELTTIKNALAHQISKAEPAFGQAERTFAQMSRPVNQMQVGQDLLDKVAPALSDYGALGQETAAKYALALRNAGQTAKKATGLKSATLGGVMEPAQMDMLESVARDIARKVNAQNLGRGTGSDTFQKLSMDNIAQQSGLPRAVGGLLDFPGISRATNWIYRTGDEKMQGLLADTLLNPKAASKLMTDAERRLLQNNPRVRQLLLQSVLRTGLLAAPAAGLANE